MSKQGDNFDEFEALLAGKTPPSRDEMQSALAEKAEELKLLANAHKIDK